MQKWLSVIGIGEEGLEGLSPLARSRIVEAQILVGGERHLSLVSAQKHCEKWVWRSPIQQTVQEILQHRGQAICVLASGDPMCYGIGVTLTRAVAVEEMFILPAPSAFSYACARLGWPLMEVETLNLCGRDPALIQVLLYPQAKLLVLSADRTTPTQVADLLVKAGYGHSHITVLENLGGSRERLQYAIANQFSLTEIADLNLLAIFCVADAGVSGYSRLAGLPDTVYRHDGQLTKREVRAITLAELAPLPGELLWDVGAGCGSVGIEWMRSDRRCWAIAIEPNASRRRHIVENAQALGTPNLQIQEGEAPAVLVHLPNPDAIFIGGGLTTEGVLEFCWRSLQLGGRLVANAVTVESEQVLFSYQQQWGGNLTRIGIQRAESLGSFLGWRAMAPVTQWTVWKRNEA
jgi:precorrin-6B C5,15-methyltransferase / cobalt-precorrin-6B C5,C15-methyltransferase